jgi:tRNA threonylcarbamoyladenosine biosynthesis protein TsaE
VTLKLGCELDTLAAGARLGAALQVLPSSRQPPGGVHIHLRGNLGAGKTTLVRGLLRELGVTGAVKSPTYTLLEPYEAGGFHLYHFDLYRIDDVEELELIGARENFRDGAICLFEWPERGEDWLPAPDLVVILTAAGDHRELQATGRGGLGLALAEALTTQADS